MNIWFQFALCAGVILIAGSQLTRHADVIADKTGLGKNWIGLVLLATVTSLPELITGISAVTLNDLPDLAVSGTLGSCMFNLLLIAGIDLLFKKKPVSNIVHEGHILSAGFGIVLIGVAAIDILFGRYLPSIPELHSMDPLSFAFIGIYLIAMKLIYSFEKHRVQEFVAEIAEGSGAKRSLPGAIFMFSLNAAFIVAAACYLPELGAQIGKTTGWGESFIGSSFIAITTSLPEITVSVAAARMGSFDMAVGNLLGSNLFNIVILAIIDFFYLKAPVLRCVSPVNSLTAIATIIATGIVVIGLTYRSQKKFWFLAGDAIAIVIVYAMVSALLLIVH